VTSGFLGGAGGGAEVVAAIARVATTAFGGIGSCRRSSVDDLLGELRVAFANQLDDVLQATDDLQGEFQRDKGLSSGGVLHAHPRLRFRDSPTSTQLC
jgi:hypothetical protein